MARLDAPAGSGTGHLGTPLVYGTTDEASGRSTVLAVLAWLQHGLVLVLTGLGLVRALLDGASTWFAPLATLALLTCYAGGVVLSRGRGTERSMLNGPAWLGLLTVAWLVTLLVSREFVWLAFSLWLLASHFLRPLAAVGYSAVVLVVVVAATRVAGEPLTVASVAGPMIGAVFAVVMSWAQYELVRIDRRRRDLVASLLAAQREAEALSAELAEASRTAGVVAERTRLSQDIHDSLAQSFSSIVLLARAVPAGAGEPQVRETLRRIEQAAADGLVESRRVVADLAPRRLGETGLVTALRGIVDAFSETTGTRATVRIDAAMRRLPTRTEVALLRSAQGALANVRDHSGADTVVVTLSDSGDVVQLDIVDDGRGFVPDPERLAAGAGLDPSTLSEGGYGLAAIGERLRELGGRLVIESAPGDGTAVSISLPLPVASENGSGDRDG